jgi:DNA-binding CsgD family transcriptional regulator
MFTKDDVSSAPSSLPTGQAPDAMQGLAATLIDEIECGLITCDEHGRLRFANRSAREELASGRALKAVDETVRSAAGSSAALDAALLDAARHGRRQLLCLGHPDDQLMASVIPLRASEAHGSTVLIMLGRRGPCSALGLEMLAMLYGLTFTERRVLGGLLAEDAPRQIAAINGVAVSTVRSHIKSIRDKFGVHNIEALLIRAAGVPPVTTAWRQFGGGFWGNAASADANRPSLARA